jgi:hypothetical protein
MNYILYCCNTLLQNWPLWTKVCNLCEKIITLQIFNRHLLFAEIFRNKIGRRLRISENGYIPKAWYIKYDSMHICVTQVTDPVVIYKTDKKIFLKFVILCMFEHVRPNAKTSGSVRWRCRRGSQFRARTLFLDRQKMGDMRLSTGVCMYVCMYVWMYEWMNCLLSTVDIFFVAQPSRTLPIHMKGCWAGQMWPFVLCQESEHQ